MIFSPLLKLLSSPEQLTELPTKALEAATVAAEQVVTTATSAITNAVTFDPGEWLLDIFTGWRDTALTWLAGMTPYGIAAVAGLWLVRRLWNRQSVRQDATWLRWQVTGDAQTIANSLRTQGRQVRSEGPTVLLVNAWDSGNVARILRAHGVRFEVAQ